MKTYFLSYARTDAEIALRFAADLIAAGVALWVDQYDIRPSQHWDQEVEAAARGCEGMIVILSPRSAASPNVADEVSVALNSQKTVIPILVEPCVPPLRMTRMQFIDATQDYDDAVRRCVSEITGAKIEAASAPKTTPLSDDVLQDAARRLTAAMGPIAPALVRAAAVRAATPEDLYRELAKSIPREAERKAFLGSITAPSQAPGAPADQQTASIDESDLVAITEALKRHLGPIAPHVVARENKLAASRQDLCARLADRIENAKDRAAFLKAVGERRT